MELNFGSNLTLEMTLSKGAFNSAVLVDTHVTNGCFQSFPASIYTVRCEVRPSMCLPRLDSPGDNSQLSFLEKLVGVTFLDPLLAV